MKSALVLLVCLASAYGQQKDCGARADIVFVVDSSGSVGKDNFLKTKSFIKSVVSNFKIGKDDVQVGVVKYDNNNWVEFDLKNHLTKAKLYTAIDNIQFTGGRTNTGLALTTMMTKSFTAAAGDRRGIPNIAIVITDGKSNDDVEAPSTAAKRKGIAMFSVGIGNSVNEKELQAMASAPTKDYVFETENFAGLNTIKAALAKKTCEVATTPKPTPAPTPKPTPPPTLPTTTQRRLKQVGDIVFAVDSSSSIGSANYRTLKNFISGVLHSFSVSQSEVRIGVVRFSDDVKLSFHLNSMNSNAAATDAIDNLPYDQGGTKTHQALEFMRQNSFQGVNGARGAMVPKIAFVVTDGHSAFPAATKTEAEKLRAMGVTVFAIGIGSAVNKQELTDITGKQDSVFTVADFSKLANIGGSISKVACNAILDTRTPLVTNTPVLECVDLHPTCDELGEDVCTDYAPWARDNCRCFCGYCKCTPKGASVCVDAIADCASYGQDACSKPEYLGWAKTNCPEFCGLCTGTPKKPSTCQDTLSNCASYGQGPCRLQDPVFRDWAATKCPRWCGLCAGGTTHTPTQPPTAKPTPAPITTTQRTSKNPSVCEDVESDCALYGKDLCSDPQFETWAETSCPKWCGICAGATQTPSCEDIEPDCAAYGKDRCYMPEFEGWSTSSCPRWCGLCPGTGTPKPSPEPTKLPTAPPTPRPTSPFTNQSCLKEVADIVIAVDSSSSIGTDNYTTLKGFIANILKSFTVSQNEVRIGIVRFSDHVKVSLHLNYIHSNADAKVVIDNLPYDQGGTKTHKVLEFMRLHSFQPVNGARGSKVPKIAIIVTDGQSAFPAATKTEADKLRSMGINIFAVGIGSAINNQELADIAGTNNQRNVFTVADFSKLATIEGSVSKVACGAILDTRTPVVGTNTPVVECVDLDPTCDEYGVDVCTDYAPWAKDNCRCFCGHCNCTPKGPSVCEDKVNCASYDKDVCSKPAYLGWIKENCPKFCGLCTGTTSTKKPAECTDKLANCGSYQASCNDPQYAGWIDDNCRKFCNRC